MMRYKTVRDISQIDFDELSSQKNFAFTDVTSVSALISNMEFLTTAIDNVALYSKMRNKLKKSPTIQNAMAIMERLIAYESVVIDEVGAKSLTGELPDEILHLEMTSIPNHIYESAGSIVHSILDDQIYKIIAKNISRYGETDDYIHYIDRLHEITTTSISTIADTGPPTLPRALFYLVLSDSCNAPIFLSPSKDNLLTYVSGMCTSDLLKDIEEETDRLLLNEVKDLSKSGISLPPLAEHIFETARKKKISIMKALIDIRDSKDAKEFRNWLHDIQVNLTAGTRPGIVKAEKQIVKLQKKVQKWADNMDIGLDVTHKYTAFGVGICTDFLKKITGIDIKLPSISFKVKDPVLNPPRHFKFIASWYKSSLNNW